MKKFKIKSFLAAAALLLPLAASAQNMEVLSYVPLKIAGGSNYAYEYLSTKSRTQLAEASGSGVRITAFKANSALLRVDASHYTLTEPVYVHNSVFARPGTYLAVENEVAVGGFFYANTDINNLTLVQLPAATKLPGIALNPSATRNAAVAGRNINMPKKDFRLNGTEAGQKIYIDKLPLYPPPAGCNPVFKSVSAKEPCPESGSCPAARNYKIFACY